MAAFINISFQFLFLEEPDGNVAPAFIYANRHPRSLTPLDTVEGFKVTLNVFVRVTSVSCPFGDWPFKKKKKKRDKSLRSFQM